MLLVMVWLSMYAMLSIMPQALVSRVCQQYSTMVSELIGMLHKTEQSLARVRKNKPADLSTAAGGTEVSNIQKISLQLLLDIKVPCRAVSTCTNEKHVRTVQSC